MKKKKRKIKVINAKKNNYLLVFKKIKIRYLLIFFISFIVSFFLIIFINKRNAQPNLVKKVEKKDIILPKITVSRSKMIDYLQLERNLYLDPLELINLIKSNNLNFSLIDLRDKKSYQREKIKKAVNYQSIEEIKKVKINKNKLIILYGDYSSSLKPKEIALNLLKEGYQVKILSVGFNEFRHLKVLWLPQSLWNEVNPDDFIERNEN